MTNPEQDPRCVTEKFSWNPANAAMPPGKVLHYSKSESVRQLLVLRALSGSKLEMPHELEQATAVAFSNVCQEIRNGLLTIDYQPLDPDTLDLPATTHPHYMQALLYWSGWLDCPLAALVEAHARLGSHPNVEAVRAAVWQIGLEDSRDRTQSPSTQRPYGAEATNEMSANTAGGAPS